MPENAKINHRWMFALGFSPNKILVIDASSCRLELRRGRAVRHDKSFTRRTRYKSLAKDLGADVQVKVATDSSAALGVIRRNKLGKLRHLETIFFCGCRMWLRPTRESMPRKPEAAIPQTYAPNIRPGN